MLGVFTSSVVKKYVTVVKNIGIWKPVTGETNKNRPETQNKNKICVVRNDTEKSNVFEQKHFFLNRQETSPQSAKL